jgi:hypothetical protein
VRPAVEVVGIGVLKEWGAKQVGAQILVSWGYGVDRRGYGVRRFLSN